MQWIHPKDPSDFPGPPHVSLKAVRAMRPTRTEIVICTGLSMRDGDGDGVVCE